MTRVAIASWTLEGTQALTLDFELTGGLTLEVAATTPPDGFDTEGPDIQHFDFPDDLELDDNGRPV